MSLEQELKIQLMDDEEWEEFEEESPIDEDDESEQGE